MSAAVPVPHQLREHLTASPWMTVSEAAAYASMTVDGVRAAERRGQLKAHRSRTGRVRFLRTDVDAFLRGSA
jgi:excisionase family DNA binding protein